MMLVPVRSITLKHESTIHITHLMI